MTGYDQASAKHLIWASSMWRCTSSWLFFSFCCRSATTIFCSSEPVLLTCGSQVSWCQAFSSSDVSAQRETMLCLVWALRLRCAAEDRALKMHNGAEIHPFPHNMKVG